MREGQFWVVRLDTSIFKKNATHIEHSSEKAFVDFGKIVTETELRSRMSGKLFYDWGYIEVSVNYAYEEFEEDYKQIVKDYQWFMPNWLDIIESNKQKS
jgi:hypothetical protein